LAEFRAGSLERWDGQSDVLVLSFGVGFEGASSGSEGLVAFRFFLNLRWPSMWSTIPNGKIFQTILNDFLEEGH